MTYSLPCNIAQSLNLIGDRWSLLILYRLMEGAGTYMDLATQLQGIPTNLLAQRLKTLEEDGLIVSHRYNERPPRYRYSLTDRGQRLDAVFYSIALWGEKNVKGCEKRLVHHACGHGVLQQYYCPHCAEAITAQEVEVTQADTPSSSEES